MKKRTWKKQLENKNEEEDKHDVLDKKKQTQIPCQNSRVREGFFDLIHPLSLSSIEKNGVIRSSMRLCSTLSIDPRSYCESYTASIDRRQKTSSTQERTAFRAAVNKFLVQLRKQAKK
jgi:hypothetical protein